VVRDHLTYGTFGVKRVGNIHNHFVFPNSSVRGLPLFWRRLHRTGSQPVGQVSLSDHGRPQLSQFEFEGSEGGIRFWESSFLLLFLANTGFKSAWGGWFLHVHILFLLRRTMVGGMRGIMIMIMFLTLRLVLGLRLLTGHRLMLY
jgi:hypothetical protein